MRSKTKRLLYTLLALMMVISLFTGVPFSTSAANPPIVVATQPVGATYELGETAVPLTAKFRLEKASDYENIHLDTPVTAQWYCRTTNSNAAPHSVAIGVSSSIPAYTLSNANPSEFSIQYTPATNAVGTLYYYAVVTYKVAIERDFVDREAVTNVVAVTVKDEQSFTVLKIDEEGNPLPGATILVVSKDGTLVYEKVTGEYGTTEFDVPNNNSYTVSEKEAPAGYKGTDREYNVTVSDNGVIVDNPYPDLPDYPITFVNTIDEDFNRTSDFTVLKTDGDGQPLAGATIRVGGINDNGVPRVYDVVTDNDGKAVFTVENGNYDITEYIPPTGYNGTSDMYSIVVSVSGVFLKTGTQTTVPYVPVTFVNKPIPKIDKDDHFAFLQGYPGGTFGPNDNMSRAEAAVMFSRLLLKKMEADDACKNDFYPDVKPTNWFAAHVGYMQDLGVLEFYSRDEKFRPNEPVTRAEFATLATAFDDLDLIDTNNFPDVPDDHWAVKFINSAAEKGWIEGDPDGKFRPDDSITRAEVATLTGRMLNRYADSEYLTVNAGSLPRTYSDVSPCWYYLAVMEASLGHNFTRDADGKTEHWTSVRP